MKKKNYQKTKETKQKQATRLNTKGRRQQNRALVTLQVRKQDQLLDFLINELPAYSRTKLKGYLSRKQIAVNGVAISQFDYPLASKDTVAIYEKSIPQAKKERLPIIYEDEDFIVINKPAGLLSVPSDKEKGETAYRYVSDYLKESNPRARAYVVQRLDKETSGVLAFVKSVRLRNALSKDWNDLVSKRSYAAVCVGTPAKKEDTLQDYLFSNFTNLMYVGKKSPDAVLAITKYKVMASNENYALLDVEIETGKKNQIRVQLKNIGHPIVGDEKYETKADPLKRLGLHAYSLVLRHPFSKKEMKFAIPIPDSFRQIVK